MDSHQRTDDPYVGLQPLSEYYLTEFVGKGRIGRVYKAERTNPAHLYACKVIPSNRLKPGWEREVQKVVQLNEVPGVVQYHFHGSSINLDNKPFVWVLWDYVDGINLRDYLEKRPWPLDLAFVENLAQTILEVLYACQVQGIHHGDLHAGNILISNPDLRIRGNPRRVWISDFGYGGSHNGLEPKDDYRQFVAVVTELLRKLDYATLNPRDRCMYHKLGEFLRRRVLETDPTQKIYVGNCAVLLEEFLDLGRAAIRESSAATTGQVSQDPGDYLWAEALGNRKEEWHDLFVPNFLAAQDLLSRNITILTGARGCGKTMAFRRLTAFMDKVIDEPSGAPGADQFVGFYLNCRDLVEAFPWLPKTLCVNAQQQIMHYFHLSWFAEICKTLEAWDPDDSEGLQWLDALVVQLSGRRYVSLPAGARVLAHVRSFIEDEKERCRISNLGRQSDWPFARIDFLDRLQSELEQHVTWIGGRPLYLFLDDYTDPIIPKEVQRILNPIIFKRRSSLFFKVSTEAANSFERESLRGKPLERNQDFELIDLANESLHQEPGEKHELLDRIFRPRIARHPFLAGRNLGLEDVLGKNPQRNNELAAAMRDGAAGHGTKKVLYHGTSAFVGMWSSDTRTMIQMFIEMLRQANGRIREGIVLVDSQIQDRIYRNAGGEFLGFAQAMTDPFCVSRGCEEEDRYGPHLKDIVEAFVNVSRHELTKGPLVRNQGRTYPKQAFRVEIVDPFALSAKALRYYDGLIRWHIFLQDWRGKSIRGMLTPRLYLNRIMIPFCELTFSSHDNIQLTSEEFERLLTRPKTFLDYWCKKRRSADAKQIPFAFGAENRSGGL